MLEFAQVLGWLATLLFTICYIPQIIKTLKTRTVDGVSLTFFIIQVIANIIALWYAILINQPPLQIKYALALILLTLVIYVYIRVVVQKKREVDGEKSA